ncbi:MAG TPA: hypothetical protein DCL38_01330 [Lachnospiraceae bacterium]|nr:hypothetical protein [Lachnospiraceae bacterium]
MTGTSINDLKSYFSQADNELFVRRPEKAEDAGNSFSKAMAEAQGRPRQAEAGQLIREPEAKSPVRTEAGQAGRKDLSERTDRTGSTDTDKTVSADRTEGTDMENGKEDSAVSDSVQKKLDKITGAIKEELGITDEELNEAMEVLNMVPLDLLDAGNVKALMMEATGTENPVELLTNESLLQGINNVVEIVNESVEELKQELSVTDEQFKELIAGLKEEDADAEVFAAGLNTEEMPKELEAEDGEPLKRPSDEGEASVDRGTQEKGALKENSPSEANESFNVNAAAGRVNKNSPGQETAGDKNEGGNSELMQQMPQTVIETSVNEAGEVVETVRQYSSYSDNAEIVNQVTEQIKVNITPEKTSMEMMLHPASLGAVHIQVTQQGDMLHAQILVQNEQVKDAIAGQMEQLLKTFEEQGQKVTEIDVSVANYNLEQGLNQNQGDNNGGNGNGESASSRRLRRTLDLNALSEEDISELSEDDRLQAEVMSMSGTSVEYRA